VNNQRYWSLCVAARLDAIDRQILKELQDDGRITNVELARRVGISAPESLIVHALLAMPAAPAKHCCSRR
jgi:GTP-sensing pleiotropic transcriptional regulator CodY